MSDVSQSTQIHESYRLNPPGTAAPAATPIQTEYSPAAQVFQVLRIIRAPLIISFLAFFVLAFPSQVHELYRIHVGKWSQLGTFLSKKLEGYSSIADKAGATPAAREFLNDFPGLLGDGLYRILPLLALGFMSVVLWYVTRHLTLVLQRSDFGMSAFRWKLLRLLEGFIGAFPLSGAALGFALAQPGLSPADVTTIYLAYGLAAGALTLLFVGGLVLRSDSDVERGRPAGALRLIVWGIVALAAATVIGVLLYTLADLDGYAFGSVTCMLMAIGLAAASYAGVRHSEVGYYEKTPLSARRAAHIALGVLVIAAILVLAFAPIKYSQIVGSIPIFALFIAGLSILVVQFTILSDRTGIPVLTILIGWALGLAFFGLGENHSVRDAKNKPVRNAVPINALDVPSIEDQFTQWFEKRPDRAFYKDKNVPYPVYIVAAQGGGIYASYHAAMFMARMQDLCDTFGQHVFAISAVSGGALGAATFTSLMRAHPLKPATPCRREDNRWIIDSPKPIFKKFVFENGAPVEFTRTTQEMTHRILGANTDFLSPLTFYLFFPDFLARFSPLPIDSFDRAIGLERAFAKAWDDAIAQLPKDETFWRAIAANPFTQSFREQQEGFAETAMPALVVATTGVSSGLPWVIAPFDMDDDESRRNFPLWQPDEGGDQMAGAAQAAAAAGGTTSQTAQNDALDISLGHAVSLSARFPWLTAPALMRVRDNDDTQTNRTGQRGIVTLADGAYFENSGVTTALDLILTLRRNKARMEEKFGQKLRFNLIVFTNTQSGEELQGSEAFSESVAPIRAVGIVTLADGAYFENSGVTTALDLILTLRRNKARMEEKFGQKLRFNLIVFTNTQSGEELQGSEAFSESVAPIRALLNSVTARSRIMIDQAERTLDGDREDCAKNPALDPRVCVNHVRRVSLDSRFLPFGWRLGPESQANIWKQLGNLERCQPNHRFEDSTPGQSANCVQFSIIHELEGSMDTMLQRLTELNSPRATETRRLIEQARRRVAALKQGVDFTRQAPAELHQSFDRETLYACAAKKLNADKPLNARQRESYEALLDYWDTHANVAGDNRVLAYALGVARARIHGFSRDRARRANRAAKRRISRQYRRAGVYGKRRGFLRLRSGKEYLARGKQTGFGDMLYREPELLSDPDIAARVLFESLHWGVPDSTGRRVPIAEVFAAAKGQKELEATIKRFRGERKISYTGPKAWWDAGDSLGISSAARGFVAKSAQKYYACLAPDAKGELTRPVNFTVQRLEK